MPPPASSQFAQNTLYDYLFSFEDGMNSGVSPLLLPKNQLAWGSNLTTRGAFIHPRPVRVQYTLDLSAVPDLKSLLLSGAWLFQGKCYYKPDSGPETLMASISGRLFQITPNPATLVATVIDVTGNNSQSATAVQCWLWQAENYVFWNDGINLPVFFDGTNTARSRGSGGLAPPFYSITNSLNGVGAGTVVTLGQVFTGSNGDNVRIQVGSTTALGTVVAGAGTTSITVNFLPEPTFTAPSGSVLEDTTVSGSSVFVMSSTTVIPAGYDPTSDTVPINLTVAPAPPLAMDSIVYISNGSNQAFQCKLKVASVGTLLTVFVQNVFVDPGTGRTIAPISIYSGSFVVPAANSPQTLPLPPQFPPGRMGAYVMGRVWMSLTNGKDFIAGDIVNSSSGTKALNFRDAVLNITENSYLVGGGLFTVPGSIGDIRAMVGTAELDVSLGQGPLQVFTPTHVFSCNSPVDRLTWQSLTNPILTVSAIGNGGLGQDSTFNVNSDVIFRSPDGIRSLMLARQDFNTWVRTPISHEVERVLNRDNQALLAFGQGAFFDNRTLMSSSPFSTPQGVYHQALVALNTDLVTTVREKKPPAYDGVWPGMNIMGLTTGQFSEVERCYQFVFNTVLTNLELWELMPSSASEVENNPNLPIVGDQLIGTPTAIEWWFESPLLFREPNLAQRTFKGLVNGEIMVDKLVGRVDFEVFWKPDRYPCWVPWFAWSECAVQNTGQPTDNTKPQFRPRMGLGSPPTTPCDPSTNRPLFQGFDFQIKIVVVGQCEFVGARFAAVVLPQPTFAPPNCSPIC